ncbi:MAG: M14 family zinc carboxypeptidase [Bacteroidota bacterium]|nr:M14 family zinc carboxypeptidase [Bacteroidota bacterium]
MKKIFSVILLLLISAGYLLGQVKLADDPCGYPDTTSLAFKIAASGNWGYGYDTLLYDLVQWKKSPFVIIDSVGATVQGRTMFVLTIQDTTSDSLNLRQRIWIHARTHPNEVQSTWVTNEMIKMLLADTELARKLRQRYIFNIMPMYNADGVQLGVGYERWNANKIDIESNWNVASPEKEVLVLRSQFQKYMAKPNPMRIMLNMHSAYVCTRYFVYHSPNFTSNTFALLEQRFINYVRMNFPDSIRPYTYYVSWVNSFPTQYPESWCWSNYKEKIMALTYEDGNCTSASMFDNTAQAILKGVDAYLHDTTSVTSVLATNNIPEQYFLEQNFPNPFNPTTTINYQLPITNHVSLKVYDVLGREVALLVNEEQSSGKHSITFNASSLSSGVYVYRLHSGSILETKRMVLMK